MFRILVVDDNADMRELMPTILERAHRADLIAAREIGAHRVLAKPFDRDELLRAVRARLD